MYKAEAVDSNKERGRDTGQNKHENAHLQKKVVLKAELNNNYGSMMMNMKCC